MWLDEWLFREKMTVTEFAKAVHISRGYASALISKKLIAGARLARDIEIFTQGKVSAKQLRKQLKEKK